MVISLERLGRPVYTPFAPNKTTPGGVVAGGQDRLLGVIQFKF